MSTAFPTPKAYCQRLRARLEALNAQRARKDAPYIVVEKILAPDESLPEDWGVDGTTGYDFMDQVSALQHDGANAGRFGALWGEDQRARARFRAGGVRGAPRKCWRTPSSTSCARRPRPSGNWRREI